MSRNGSTRPGTLLVVHHTPSPAVHELLDAVLAALTHPELQQVEIHSEPALSATAPDVLSADGLVLLTPANIGYMSGALKHFFDTVYYPCLSGVARPPYGLVVHGNDDTSGAVRSVERIATALRWESAGTPVSVLGPPSAVDRDRAGDLAATVAARLLP